jgi:hypothetical protein
MMILLPLKPDFGIVISFRNDNTVIAFFHRLPVFQETVNQIVKCFSDSLRFSSKATRIRANKRVVLQQLFYLHYITIG